MADSALPTLQDLQEWHDPLSRRSSASKSSAILLLLARRQSGEALSWSVWTDGKAARRSPASSGLTAERRGALRLRLECGLSGERARCPSAYGGIAAPQFLPSVGANGEAAE